MDAFGQEIGGQQQRVPGRWSDHRGIVTDPAQHCSSGLPEAAAKMSDQPELAKLGNGRACGSGRHLRGPVETAARLKRPAARAENEGRVKAFRSGRSWCGLVRADHPLAWI